MKKLLGSVLVLACALGCAGCVQAGCLRHSDCGEAEHCSATVCVADEAADGGAGQASPDTNDTSDTSDEPSEPASELDAGAP